MPSTAAPAGASCSMQRSACIRRAGSANTRSNTLRKRLQPAAAPRSAAPEPTGAPAARWRCSPPATATATNRKSASIWRAVFEHNGIEVALAEQEHCCGMPKLELGDLQAVARLKARNMPQLIAMIDRGYDIVAPVPSCVLMFKQELPLMFPDDADVRAVQRHMFDPFEYLMLRHKAGLLRTDFTRPLGKISYHVACHLRVQNIGLKTRDMLQLIPGTTVEPIERCSGHDGTYAREAGVPRRLDEDRQAGDAARRGPGAQTITPATARWRATRSKAGLPDHAAADPSPHPAAHGLRPVGRRHRSSCRNCRVRT